MSKITIVFLAIASFIGLMKSQRIWDGDCGKWTMEQHLAGSVDHGEGTSTAKKDGFYKLNRWDVIIRGPITYAATLIRVRQDNTETDVALTSAEACRFIENLRTFYVAAFALQPGERSRTSLAVRECVHHPDYDPETGENDVGILFLGGRVRIGRDSHLRAVCLPPEDEAHSMEEGRKGTATAFIQGRFRPLNMRIANRRECVKQGNGWTCAKADDLQQLQKEIKEARLQAKLAIMRRRPRRGPRLEITEDLADSYVTDEELNSEIPHIDGRVKGTALVSEIDGKWTMLGIAHDITHNVSPVLRLAPYLVHQGSWIEEKIRSTSIFWNEKAMMMMPAQFVV